MFAVPAQAYGRFMGRFSEPLADALLDRLDPRPGQRAVDVGCGPGVVTARLVERLGPDAVVAIDPSAPFVAAARERLPGVDVRLASAEHLPLPDGDVDLAVAQLVVHFMTDPVGGLREMARATRPGGVVAASVWDYVGDRSPLSRFWSVARRIDPGAPDESGLPGAGEGELVRLLTEAGLRDVEQQELSVTVRIEGFDDWWEPYTYGIGPVGAYVAALDDDARARLRAACADVVPEGPFEVGVTAWLGLGRTP